MKTFFNFIHRQTAQVTTSPSENFLLDYDWLETQSSALSCRYRTAHPYPHIVIENFLRPPLIQALLNQYPHDKQNAEWQEGTYKQVGSEQYVQKSKRHLADLMAMPKIYRELIWELHSNYFLKWLSELTGIRHLIPDPGLFGAGIHEISRGGLLKVHSDFATHRHYGLDRRLNFLLYLNEPWEDAWGGHLELWDNELAGPPVKVAPRANTCVIFSTTGTSWHGHPHPLECPPTVTRKSLALYYYTNGRPEGEAEPGTATHWRDVPKV